MPWLDTISVSSILQYTLDPYSLLVKADTVRANYSTHEHCAPWSIISKIYWILQYLYSTFTVSLSRKLWINSVSLVYLFTYSVHTTPFPINRTQLLTITHAHWKGDFFSLPHIANCICAYLCMFGQPYRCSSMSFINLTAFFLPWKDNIYYKRKQYILARSEFVALSRHLIITPVWT